MTSKASGMQSRSRMFRELKTLISQFRLSSRDYLNVTVQLWQGLNTPLSLSCALLLKYGEYEQLVNKKVLVSDYPYEVLPNSGYQPNFEDDYLAVSILSKWPNFQHPELDPEMACKQAAADAEKACAQSNQRLRANWNTPCQENSAYLHLISQMQADIARVLGPFDPTRWELSCRFGPGKAQGQRGEVDYEKLVNSPSCTASFLPFGLNLISSSIPWLEAVSNSGADPFSTYVDERERVYKFDVQIEPGDRYTMVPKNAKTHRSIRAQPGLNVFAQLGIGVMLRDQLALNGLDLNTQEPNQALAKLGSSSLPSIVTLDLKGASDHICTYLVRLLFRETDPGWLHAMELCRTTMAEPFDGEGQYETLKSFSAMGNGYTFELESLIFWSAVRAVRRKVQDTTQYRVYGDDIICSRLVADELIPFLTFLGFPINTGKTFLEGPFRESCGEDYWYGTNIRPIFLTISEEEMEDSNANGSSVMRWVQTCNAIRRLAHRRNRGFGCDARLLPAWRFAILQLPKLLRDSLKSPWRQIGDQTIICSDDEARENPLVKRCTDFQCLVSPSLVASMQLKQPRYLLGAKATLLYRLYQVDRPMFRFDRVRSWLNDWLLQQSLTETRNQEGIRKYFTPGRYLSGDGHFGLPDRYAINVGVGWEVFQPIGGLTIWLGSVR